VLVVDDQQLIREGIASVLDIQAGISVVGTATNGEEAVAQAEALVPDLILMDVHMPVMDGIGATERVRQHYPDCQVVMLTTFDDDEYIIRSLQAGACGYLLKDIPARDLAQAVRLAHSGVYQLAPEVAGKLVGSFEAVSARTETAVRIKNDLTKRELEVLRLLSTGATNGEIAAQLVVSEGTVKNHVSNILGQLGVRDRTQAAIYAIENKLFD
jgi:DNA-binding NarL/FixJ family response regulator